MKFTIDRAAMLAALKHVAAAADPRSTMPQLACVRIKLDGNRLQLAATDINVTVSADLPVTAATGKGSALINAAALLRTIDRMSGKDVAIADGGTHVEISSGRAKATEPTLKAADFPRIHEPDVPMVGLDAERLRAVIEACLPAVCEDETRFHLNGVMLRFAATGILGAATDGHRMHVRVEDTPCPLTASRGIIVPRRALVSALKVLDVGEVEVALSSAHLHLRGEGISVAAKLIDAQFPPFEQVVPTEHKLAATFVADEFVRAMRRVALASGDAGAALIDSANGELQFRAADGDRKVSDAIEVEGGKAILAHAALPAYLIDAVERLDCERVAVYVGRGEDPIAFTPAGAKFATAATVNIVMPMRR